MERHSQAITVERKTLRRASFLVHLFLAVVAGYLVFGIDEWRAISLQPMAYAKLLGICILVMSIPLVLCRHRGMWITLAIWFLLAGVLPRLNNCAIKPLLRGTDMLTIGMDRDQVLAVLCTAVEDAHFPAPVVFNETENRIVLKPVGRHAGYSAESMILYFQDRRFTRALFVED